MKYFFLVISLLLSFNISASFITAQNHLDKQEFQKSFNEFHKVAKLGNVKAQYNVALMLFKGKGVEKNTVKAYAWSRTAGSSKSSTKELTDTISKSLSNEQLKDAQDLATKYIKLYGIQATKTLIGPIISETDSKTSQNYQLKTPLNYNEIVKNQKSEK